MSDSPSGDSEQGPEDLRSDSKKKSAVVMTTQPTNESELQLYRVLQRANLLNYYDTFISQGGDDVQQLCEAGEEEFLEIMALVGMASKPLHVRRLQKALQEWVQNPALFQTPLVPTLGGFPTAVAAAAVIRATGGAGVIPQVSAPSIVSVPPPVSIIGGVSPQASLTLGHHVPSLVPTSSPSLPNLLAGHQRSSLPSHSPPLAMPLQQPSRPPSNNSPSPALQIKSDREERQVQRPIREAENLCRGERTLPGDRDSRENLSSPQTRQTSLPSGASEDSRAKTRPPNISNSWDPSTGCEDQAYSGDPPGPPSSPLQLTPVLVESQIQRIADTASALVKSLPDLEPKQPNAKKKICKELEFFNKFQIVMSMSDEDSRKMDEIRKFSAIYGRFDCKRKPEKPLTLHEVSVNEAAAQICRLVPAMLTRRDELFPLARQVVRDSGYQYSKGHSRSTFSLQSKFFNGDDNWMSKRMRYSEDSELTQRRRERVEQIADEERLYSDSLEDLRGRASQARVAGDVVSLQHISQQIELYQVKRGQLQQERDEHQRIIRFSSRMSTCSDPDRPDTDDETSQRSYSNASSPSASLHAPPNYDPSGPLNCNLADNNGKDASRIGGFGRESSQETKIISASGNQIIAVQNPALTLSGAFPNNSRGVSPPTSTTPTRSGILVRPSLSGSPSSLKQEPSSPSPSRERE